MSNTKFILKHALILFAIAFICSLLLILCNNLTEGRIAQLQAKAEADAQSEVLPEAKSFDTMDSTVMMLLSDSRVSAAFKGTAADGSTAGYCIKVEPTGFGGKISMMVGVSTDGEICGVKITSMNETPGLGAKANDTWLAQFKGKNGDISVIKSGTAKDNEINAISGATITSKAVSDGVNIAVSAVKTISKAEGDING